MAATRRPGITARWLACGLALWAAQAVLAREATIDGTLLFDTERRAEIRARRLKSLESPGATPEAEAAAHIREPAPQRLDGLVYRSSGRGAYWINGERRFEGDPASTGTPPPRLLPDAVEIDRHPLKAGQTWNAKSQTLQDLLPTGAATRTPPP